MLKKICIVLVMVLLGSTVLFGQQDDELNDEKEKPEFGFNMNMTIGLSSYEDSQGNQVAFQRFSFFPEFSYGKWGLGLDLTFEFDGDFNLRDLDNNGKPDTWCKFSDYLYKIYYLRYGHKGDPLYGRLGAFESYTLGHGLIMQDFSNTLFYPQIHQLGLNLDIDGEIFNFPFIGMESVVDDVLDWDIIGVRVYARPLTGLQMPIISELKVAGSIVTDRDPQEITDPGDPNYDDYSSPKDNPASDPVTELGLDTELPLLQRQNMSLITYADWAKIVGKGSGSMLGSTFAYKWFSLIGQLRFLGKQFEMNYFDSYYEVERDDKYAALDNITKFYAGYLVGTDLSLFNFFRFYFHWSDGFNDPTGPRIQSGIGTVEGALPKIDARFTYDKKDIQSFRDVFSGQDSLMQLRVAYKVSKIAAIVFIYQRTYTPSGKSTDQSFIETQFSF